jgi:hypothetical protein
MADLLLQTGDVLRYGSLPDDLSKISAARGLQNLHHVLTIRQSESPNNMTLPPTQ